MNERLSPTTRRLILGGAVLGAIIVALGPHSPAVHAGETVPPTPPAATRAAPPKAPGPPAAIPAATTLPPSAAKATVPDATAPSADAAAAPEDDDADVTLDRHGIRVESAPGGKKKHVIVGISGTDREYDSVDQFRKQDPELFAIVAVIVFIVFLTPVLIIALLIWYKLRKNRMLNDTMLQLAEKGVIAPTEAMQALGSGRMASAANMVAAHTPLTEQARLLRSHAVWSDLRKGVILGALGLAFCAYSILDDHTPNWIGLILLFLGLGYTLLWFFEERRLAAPSDHRPPSPPAGGA